MLTREVEQHDPEQDREQSLARNARQRQNNSERNQQDAGNIFADELGSVERRITSGPELRLVPLAEVIGGKLDQNERNDREIDSKSTQKNQSSDEYAAPRKA